MSSHHLLYLIIVVATCSKHTCVLATQFQDHDDGYFRNLPCPNAEDIAPCACIYWEESNVMDMYCPGILDEQQLYTIFHSAIPFPNFRKLTLGNNHLSRLEDTVFGDVTFEDVQTYGTGTLTYVGPNTFMKSAYTLMTLELYDNNLSEFPFETLSQYTQLTFFSLYGNSVSYFPIIKSESLKSLYLGYNGFDTIPKGALDGLPSLEEFDANGNSVSYFPLIKSESLKTLRLAYNAFDTIPKGALDGLPSLEVFDAHGNDIHTMATGLFTSLPNIQIIDLAYARLTHLESQQFGVISRAVREINLYSNEIETVDAGAFSGIQSGHINLRDNKLTILPEDTWRPVIDAGVTLQLYGNDLICGCDVAWLVLEPLYHEQVVDAWCHSGEKLVELDPDIYELC